MVFTDFVFNVLWIFLIIFAMIVIWCSVTIIKYFKLKRISLEQEIEYEKLLHLNRNKTTDNTESLIKIIRMIVGQIAVLKFREFQDKHRMDIDINTEDGWKVNRTNFESLIEDIATTSYKSINMDNIIFDDLFFTQDFYENYVIQTSIMLVKQMLGKTLDELSLED